MTLTPLGVHRGYLMSWNPTTGEVFYTDPSGTTRKAPIPAGRNSKPVVAIASAKHAIDYWIKYHT